MKNAAWELKYIQVVGKVKINQSPSLVGATVKSNLLPTASSGLASAPSGLTHLGLLLGFQFVRCHWEMTCESSSAWGLSTHGTVGPMKSLEMPCACWQQLHAHEWTLPQREESGPIVVKTEIMHVLVCTLCKDHRGLSFMNLNQLVRLSRLRNKWCKSMHVVVLHSNRIICLWFFF